MTDWTGNAGFRHHNIRSKNAEPNDYYATEPKAVELLLKLEEFSNSIWEPACGEGHISKVLEAHGYNVISSDLINRGHGVGGVDFLSSEDAPVKCDIITNPPYKRAKEFAEKALEIIEQGHKVAMFLKLTFLEGKARKKLFEKYPPKTVYVSSSRLNCARNGDFKSYEDTKAVAYAWFVWEKGYKGDTTIKWFN